MRGKIHIKKSGGQKQKIKIRYLTASLIIMLGACKINLSVNAAECPNVRIVFARGSGGELNNDQNYLEFKNKIEIKLATTSLTYDFVDLDYPAIGVGVDNLDVTLGAYFGAGESYEFGDSVKSGVKKLDKLVNSSSCPNTKFVLGGYSQGAMVISKALGSLNPDKIIYAATFGDPKLYLPEGEGFNPPACSNKNLSDYRVYVPDCHAHEGLLGANIPYEPAGYTNKLGTWCNKNDIFCSSHLNIGDHLAYIDDGLYEDASRVIFDKITKFFGLENHITSPHDTAIIIDSTGSMASLINKYKNEAFRLAKETLESGGRVALYDYRDLDDPYQPVEHCNFETCTLETITRELDTIQAENGGDGPESLLSASFHVMQNLTWQRGATKSIIVLTDAGFLSPDRDGITYAEVVRLSKTIDPVNFYIITESKIAEYYQDLANDTDGLVVADVNEFSLLTDYIMERYDSLPRVEEGGSEPNQPYLEINEILDTAEQFKISYSNTGNSAIVVLNGRVLGIANETEVIIHSLDRSIDNNLILIPINDDIRGEGVEIKIASLDATLKAPNTGQL